MVGISAQNIAGSVSPSEWGEMLASRLRLIQIKARHESASVRQKLITEEIKSALLEIGPAARLEYLSALKEYFPTPERIESGDESPTESASPQSARQLVRRLASIFPTLDPQTASQLRQEIKETIFSKEAVQEPLDAPLLGRLGLGPNEKLHPARLVELSEVLIDFAVETDRNAWSFWAQIAPNSPLRPEPLTAHFRRSVGQFLRSDKEISAATLKRALDKTGSLFSGILSSLSVFAEKYARRHLETFAPDRIRASVGGDSPGVRLGVEQKCWKRYTTLALALNGPSIEHQINRTIVSETEAAVANNSSRRSGGEYPTL
jgi:hypothetical protein